LAGLILRDKKNDKRLGREELKTGKQKIFKGGGGKMCKGEI